MLIFYTCFNRVIRNPVFKKISLILTTTVYSTFRAYKSISGIKSKSLLDIYLTTTADSPSVREFFMESTCISVSIEIFTFFNRYGEIKLIFLYENNGSFPNKFHGRWSNADYQLILYMSPFWNFLYYFFCIKSFWLHLPSLEFVQRKIFLE